MQPDKAVVPLLNTVRVVFDFYAGIKQDFHTINRKLIICL